MKPLNRLVGFAGLAALVTLTALGSASGATTHSTVAAATSATRGHWFAGTVTAVATGSLTVGVLWTGPHDGALNGETLTVAIGSTTRISQGAGHVPIALAQIVPDDLVALRAAGSTSAALTASMVHVYCNCHWVAGTISSIGATGTSFTVQVRSTGPYDGVLKAQNITLQTNDDSVYLRGARRARIAFTNLQVGDGVGVVFSANGFFKAPGFVPSTASFVATRVHIWAHKQVPPLSSDVAATAQTST
jgi:hypothetical protein